MELKEWAINNIDDFNNRINSGADEDLHVLAKMNLIMHGMAIIIFIKAILYVLIAYREITNYRINCLKN